MKVEELETERLLLRKITPEILSQLFENCSDAEIMKQLGLINEQELIKEREKSQGGYKTYDRTILSFLLVVKDNGKIIGRCGYHNWYKDHHKAELGYALNNEEYKRKGYMSEAVGAILEYGFKSMNLNRIEACAGPNNIASLSIIKKYGFFQEGYLRQHYVRDNETQDSFIFSLLKEEYESGKHSNTPKLS